MRKSLLIGLVVFAACGEEPVSADVDVDADADADGDADVDGDADATGPGPEVRVVGTRLREGGVWREGGARVQVALEGERATVSLAAGPALAVEAVEVELAVALPGATAWLSNGFQSWSQSGALALPSVPPSESEVRAALAARGDQEVIRDGSAVSWWTSWVAGPTAEAGPALMVGALMGTRLAPSVTAWRDGEEVRFVLRSGGVGDALAVGADDAAPIERWYVAAASGAGALEVLSRALGEALPSRRATHRVEAEVGWNSWYELWSDVDEVAVRANADKLAELVGGDASLVPVDAPPLRIVVDDGWQMAWGDWYPNDKFPSGLNGLADDLRAEGFRMGVWFAPLLAHADSEVATTHPEWFVEGASFDHVIEGPMRILDPFHPGAAQHLRDTAARIVGWGYDLLKIDFLFAGTYPGGRAEARTGLEAYVRALELLREGAGEDAVLLAVGNPATPALPHVDLWRVGGDIAVEPLGPSFPFVVNTLRTIAARWPFCVATLCDPDPPLLRGLPEAQVHFGAWVAALAGGGLFLSDDLRVLEASRADVLTPGLVGTSLSGSVAWPLDLVPPDPPEALQSPVIDHLAGTMTQVAPTRWRLPNGRVVRFDAATGVATLERWRATPGTTWQLQLEGVLDRGVDAEAYDVDLYDTSPAELASLARAGRILICYFSAGSWEDWRPDATAFPSSTLGKTLEGFPDERWLDVRAPEVRAALAGRLDLAVARGCDAVDPDNVEGYLVDTGFDLSANDQLDFNRWLAREAHARGLAVGLKNDLEQVVDLASDFDFAVNESCLVWEECAQLHPFVKQGKAVFHVEYAAEGQTLEAICDRPECQSFSTILKQATDQVDAWREACPAP